MGDQAVNGDGEARLFPVEAVADIVPDGEAGALSATQRLTARNRALLAQGIHPATRRPLIDGPWQPGPDQPGPTCGSCAHHVVHGHNVRRYHKCGLVLITSGAGTDIRTSWPACTSWKAEASA